MSYTDELRSVTELLNDFRVRRVTFKPCLSLFSSLCSVDSSSLLIRHFPIALASG